jgi:putative exosortase-associated protein (TIGR04073 family)
MKVRLLAATASLAMAAALAIPSPAPAVTSTSIEEASPQEIVGGIANKTIRGVANVATGWVEIPKQIYLTFSEEGPAKGLTAGPLNGIGMTLVRTVTGVVEIATFFIPVPGFYDPLVEPEYVWQKE